MSMASYTPLVFHEGAGFVFLETLGQGNNGRADLVVSAHDGCLYVRKQLKTAYPVARKIYNQPQREITMATHLRGLDGVAQLQGWFIYADCARDIIEGDVATFEVTYWDYCGNSGTLHSILGEAESRSVSIPEVWICSWLIQGITVLLNLHNAGFVHQDAHGGNWFLHRTDDSTPRVILGDFDDATKPSPTETKEMQRLFQMDYKKLARALMDALSTSGGPNNGLLLAMLTTILNWPTSFLEQSSNIDQRMHVMRDEAKELLQRLPPLTFVQEAILARPRIVPDLQPFEQFLTWSPFVQRYMPISPDPGFEMVAGGGWSAPFVGR